jgi:tRNA (cytidine32/uridine32-2'-O)-methyltransferase
MVETTHPGNIGAAARVMANLGLADLRLVRPRVFPAQDATARAAGAEHILEQAIVCDTLEEATAGCSFVIGATARRRTVGSPLLEPQNAASQLIEASRHGSTALVFGQEAAGLTNEHLDLCHSHVRVGVEDDFPSLNVATAVAILIYEVRRQSCSHAPSEDNGCEIDPRLKGTVPMTVSEFERLMEHLERVGHRTGFLVGPRTRLLRKMRRLLRQGVCSQADINIIRGVLTSIEHTIEKGEASGER